MALEGYFRSSRAAARPRDDDHERIAEAYLGADWDERIVVAVAASAAVVVVALIAMLMGSVGP
jgi:hypothetical protein